MQELLRRTRSEPAEQTDGFASYAVDQSDSDPLVSVLHELINHAASQEQRIGKLCRALEDLGQRVENGHSPIDADRLNQMVE